MIRYIKIFTSHFLLALWFETSLTLKSGGEEKWLFTLIITVQLNKSNYVQMEWQSKLLIWFAPLSKKPHSELLKKSRLFTERETEASLEKISSVVHSSCVSWPKPMIDCDISKWMVSNCSRLCRTNWKKSFLYFQLNERNSPLDGCNFLFIYTQATSRWHVCDL